MKVSTLNLDEYNNWVSHFRVKQNIFATRDWIRVFGDRILLVACSHFEIECVFVLYKGGKYGIHSIITPPAAPCIGFAEREDNTDRKKYIVALLDFLPTLNPAWIKLDLPVDLGVDCSSVFTFQQIEKYTYRLRLTPQEDSIASLFSSKIRNGINKALRDESTAQVVAFSSALSERVAAHFERKGIRSGLPFVHSLIRGLMDKNKAFAIEVTQSGNLLWTGVFILDRDVCYYLFGALNPEISSRTANTFGLWSAMKESARREVLIFDFEGSMIPSVEEFVKGFGGQKTTYACLTKSSLLWKLASRFIIK